MRPMREYQPVQHLTADGWVTQPGVMECSTCGVAVANRQVHDDWHERYGTEPTIVGDSRSLCGSYAEITAPDFLPISCDRPAGHHGDHSCNVTVTIAQGDMPNKVMWA